MSARHRRRPVRGGHLSSGRPVEDLDPPPTGPGPGAPHLGEPAGEQATAAPDGITRTTGPEPDTDEESEAP